jgi:hypothetical protein
MNLFDARLKFEQAKTKAESLKNLVKSKYASVPTGPKVVYGVGFGIILLVVIYFYVAPPVTGFISEYFKEREYQKDVKDLRKDQIRHETNANKLANQRLKQEKDWGEFQPERERAQSNSDNSEQQLKNQQGAYEDATKGNVNTNPNLSRRERRRRVLRTDRELYPDAKRSGGNANASTNTAAGRN